MVKDDGKYGLINLALDAPKVIEYKCQQLLKLTSKINNQKMAKPSFLMVLMGIGKYACMCRDGVLVVPIGTLKD